MAADTVKLDNRVVAGAVRAARFAARVGRPVTSCPYRGDEADVAALRRVWLSTYLRERPPAKGAVSYNDGGKVSAAAVGDSTDDEAERVQAQYEAALAALLATWPTLAGPLVDDLTAQVDGADVGALAGLAASAVVVDGITAALLDAMVALAVAAGGLVAATAAANGVTVEQPPPDEGRLAEIAAVTAAVVASAYASAAARRAMLAPAGAAASVVRAALTEMSAATRGLVADNLGAALSIAQGQGRLAVLASAPAIEFVGVETNDSNRCGPCTAAHMRRYPTLADALRERPAGGQLAACEGGPRCRGFLTAIWV
jgi:hypothetical protein